MTDCFGSGFFSTSDCCRLPVFHRPSFNPKKVLINTECLSSANALSPTKSPHFSIFILRYMQCCSACKSLKMTAKPRAGEGMTRCNGLKWILDKKRTPTVRYATLTAGVLLIPWEFPGVCLGGIQASLSTGLCCIAALLSASLPFQLSAMVIYSFAWGFVRCAFIGFCLVSWVICSADNARSFPFYPESCYSF